MYSAICQICGNEFTAGSKKAKYCHDCCLMAKSEADRRRKERQNRPCTADTEFLVCVYTHRGDSISRIAADLSRSKESVKGILNKAKSSGAYDRHIKIHEIRGV